MCEHVITYFTFLPTFQCLIVGTIQFRAVRLVVVAQATMWSSMTNVECRSVLLTQQPTGMCIVCMNWTRLGREFTLGPWAIVLCRTGGRVMPFIDASFHCPCKPVVLFDLFTNLHKSATDCSSMLEYCFGQFRGGVSLGRRKELGANVYAPKIKWLLLSSLQEA